MTTELVVKTITFEPAKIEFNFDQLSGILDENLIKYEGLEFTDKTAGDCSKTIAELRKGKTMLDTYRKDTKKQLTVSITDFENQCKLLNAKFDEVISPLVDQYDQFEYNRKERKRKEIQSIIDGLVTEQGLIEKFSVQLIIPDQYLNKGTTMKSITTELTALAESLGIQQDKDAADVEIIKTNVKLANATHQLAVGLVETTYVSLLAFESVESIIEKINADAENIKQREEAAVDRLIEKAKKQVPVNVPAPEENELTYIEKFVIEGTESQLQALEEFLETNDLIWKIVENDD